MINGYTKLNKNVNQTVDLISDVEDASKEQVSGIEQINNAVTSFDNKTQQNIEVSTQTQDIVECASVVVSRVVREADAKEFNGKDILKKRKQAIDLTYQGNENRALEKEIKEHYNNKEKNTTTKKSTTSSEQDIPINNYQIQPSEDDGWTSF